AVTILGVAEDADKVEPLRAALEERRQEQALERAEVKVRTGDPAHQIAVEQQETFYELLVLAAARGPVRRGQPGGASRLLMNLLERPVTPLLVVNGSPAAEALERVLICTRAGEPGKSDVRVGGWLARRLGASAT